MSVLSVAVLALFSVAQARLGGDSVKPVLSPSRNASSSLPGAVNFAAGRHAAGSNASGTVPCPCEEYNSAWKPCTRTYPMCVFIDLGAANGNTFQDFMSNKYGPVAECPGGHWHATLVEANPHFNAPLQSIATTYGPAVYAASSTAAYMCDAQTTFYLDTKNHKENYWGSSMSPNHVDVQKSGMTQVTVPTVNLIRILYEGTIPGDYVIVKMDIEGAEWDVMPCLARAPAASLIDRMYVEVHPQSWGNMGTTQQDMDMALVRLRQRGIHIPKDYHSQTFIQEHHEP
mmetsp:Transcript_47749/g.84069  ORF Transcript_47749/g.84069 Transcript_47749/m.84069 type:complete len:286 (-) Transcript_47749:87-944(-)